MIPKCKTALCQITSLLYNGVPLKPPAFFCGALSYSAEAGSQLRHVSCYCFPLFSIVIMMISTPFHLFGALHFLWNFYFFGNFIFVILAHIIETTFFYTPPHPCPANGPFPQIVKLGDISKVTLHDLVQIRVIFHGFMELNW